MKDLVGVDDFNKLDLRVGEIMGATVPEGSETLIKLTVDFGDEGKRVIMAGIKEWYTAEELVGRKSVFVLNMQPKQTPFGESEGMLLAVGGPPVGEASERAQLLAVPDEVKMGAALR